MSRSLHSSSGSLVSVRRAARAPTRSLVALACALVASLAALPARADACRPVFNSGYSTPTTVLNRDCRAEQFENFGGVLNQRWESRPGSGYGGWGPVESQILYRPAAVQNTDGRLEVFVIGAQHHMFHRWQLTPGGSWSGWEDLGGNLTSAPEIRYRADGSIEVRAWGPDNIWHYMRQTAPSQGPWIRWY